MIEFHKDEQILAEVHRHWLPLLGQGLVFLLLAAFPFLVDGALILVDERIAAGMHHYRAHVFLLETSWVMLLWMGFAIAWTNHYLDVLIITDRRILDIEQIGLFSRDIAELRVDNIEDVRIEVPGLLASWFKFGNVELQTAAESKAFMLTNIEHPERVRALISKMRDEYHQAREER